MTPMPAIAGGRAIEALLGPCRCQRCGWTVWWAKGRPQNGHYRGDGHMTCWRERNGERHVCREEG